MAKRKPLPKKPRTAPELALNRPDLAAAAGNSLSKASPRSSQSSSKKASKSAGRPQKAAAKIPASSQAAPLNPAQRPTASRSRAVSKKATNIASRPHTKSAQKDDSHKTDKTVISGEPVASQLVNPVVIAPEAAAVNPVGPRGPLSSAKAIKAAYEQRKIDRRRALDRWILGASLLVLLLTTVYWSTLSAHLHQSNSDQLIDSFLFESSKTFNGATFPGTHTFLLKWPLFALMQLFGNSLTVFSVVTVSIVLVTVGFLLYMVSRFEKRPIALAIYALALSSVFLLIPAQPSPGTLLPVNMAMTTTRNLEYVVFVIAAYMAVTRLRQFKPVWLVVVTALLVTVIASDKLFLVLALGSAVVGVLWLWFQRFERKAYIPVLLWASASVAAAIVARIVLFVLDRSGVTSIDNGGATSPYAVITDVSKIATALIYGAGAILTNFGANPVHSIMTIRDMGGGLMQSFKQFSFVGYLTNFLLLLMSLFAAAWIVGFRAKEARTTYESGRLLSVMLIGALVAASSVYVMTDHYYPVDARYLTIGLFALTIAAAVYFADKKYQLRVALPVLVLLLVAIPAGMGQAMHEFNDGTSAMATRTALSRSVAGQLDKKQITRLVGNYWDVTPVKADAQKPVTIAPVDNCNVPRPVLNSTAWFNYQIDTPTAYLAIRDGSAAAGPDHARAAGSVPTYGGCTLPALVSEYGVPAERIPITTDGGTPVIPNVLLLMYPSGIKDAQTKQREAKEAANVEQSKSKPAAKTTTSNLPIDPLQLVALGGDNECPKGTTLQIIAHQDDDILFMNPDMYKEVDGGGHCLRTVYLTAGNAGEGPVYWLSREAGAKAAYAQMYDSPDSWQEKILNIAGHKISVNYLDQTPQVSLIFLRLPDGNLRGQGFATNQYQSLKSLHDGVISSITPVDAGASFGQQDIINVLAAIMNVDQPNQIRTQASDNQADGDHSDHHAAGFLADQASALYTTEHSIMHYLGYPEQYMAVNIDASDIQRKQSMFLTYAKHDGAVCQTLEECQHTTYGIYFGRQYQPGAAH